MRFVHLGFSPATVDYLDAWEQQRRLHRDVVAGQAPSTVLLLEHTAVYTAGKRTLNQERPHDGTAVINVDRGGKITWHGPGQLVGYPILVLPDPLDVVAYVRDLEEVMIRTAADFGVNATRVEGRSGIWVPADQGRPERKIGQIGIRVSQGVSMHGFALNCDCDMSWADQIIPCGIPDAGVSNLSLETGHTVGVQDVLPVVEHHIDDVLARYDVPARCPLSASRL